MIKWPWNISHTHQMDKISEWQEACNMPITSWLSSAEQQKLVDIATQFLQHKRLNITYPLVLTESDKKRVALLFALPVLNLGFDYLDGFHEITLYDNKAHPEFISAPLNSAHDPLCSDHYKLQFYWQDIVDSYDLSGFNIIIHATAHQLDLRNSGVANGLPQISLRHIPGWEYHLRQVMQSLEEEIELMGEGAVSMDADAGYHPAECFAVLSEYFFSAPELIFQRFPEMYQHLSEFYQQNPQQRLIYL